MQFSAENIHIGMSVLGILGSAAVAWMGLSVKNAIMQNQLANQTYNAKVKEELVAESTKVREALTSTSATLSQSHAVLVGKLETHTASDDLQFKAIGQALERIERKGAV